MGESLWDARPAGNGACTARRSRIHYRAHRHEATGRSRKSPGTAAVAGAIMRARDEVAGE
jgi:hypothetical protein